MSAALKPDETINDETTRDENIAAVLPMAAPEGHAQTLRAAAEANRGKPMKELAQSRTDMFRLNPYDIQVVAGFNCRNFSTPENIQHVTELARSICSRGVREPITVFTQKNVPGVFLADGECRLRATIIAIEEMGANIISIPAKLENRFNTSDADRVFSQFERNGGKNFTVMEMADAFIRCIDGGYTEKQLVEKSGYTAARIRQILAFKEDASSEIQQLVVNGQVSVGLAQQVISQSHSVAAAGKVLTRAVKTAKEAGKTKATAKHVTGKIGQKLNLKKALAEIFEAAKVRRVGENQVVTFASDEYNRLTDLLGIGIAG